MANKLDRDAVISIRRRLRKFIEDEAQRTKEDFNNGIISGNQNFKILQILKSLNEFVLDLDIAIGSFILTDIEEPKNKIEGAIDKIDQANEKLKVKAQMFSALGKLLNIITTIVGVIGAIPSPLATINASIGFIESIVAATDEPETEPES